MNKQTGVRNGKRKIKPTKLGRVRSGVGGFGEFYRLGAGLGT